MLIPRDVIRGFLRNIDLLRDLSEADIALLVPHLEILTAAADERLFSEGAAGSAWYILLEGNVSIRRRMAGGEPHELGLLHPGECFGEMALMDGAPRMASAVVVNNAVLARLSRDGFDRLIESEHRLGCRLLRSMSRVICHRQRELTWLLQEMVDFDADAEAADSPAHASVLRNVTWN